MLSRIKSKAIKLRVADGWNAEAMTESNGHKVNFEVYKQLIFSVIISGHGSYNMAYNRLFAYAYGKRVQRAVQLIVKEIK